MHCAVSIGISGHPSELPVDIVDQIAKLKADKSSLEVSIDNMRTRIKEVMTEKSSLADELHTVRQQLSEERNSKFLV